MPGVTTTVSPNGWGATALRVGVEIWKRDGHLARHDHEQIKSLQTQCNVPPPNELQAYKDFHSKTTVVCTFRVSYRQIPFEDPPVIRPFNWFEELNVLFGTRTTEGMTLPLNWTFSCYRTQHPTGLHFVRVPVRRIA